MSSLLLITRSFTTVDIINMRNMHDEIIMLLLFQQDLRIANFLFPHISDIHLTS